MRRALLFAGICICLLAGIPVSAKMQVVFHGGAGRVGGSCALVQSGSTRVLVDCGAFYGSEFKPGEAGADGAFGFDPASVCDLVLTHAHADHAGRLAQLLRAGFAGTLWMTEPTRALLESSMDGQARYERAVARNWRWSVRTKRRTVHWRPACEWSRRISDANLKTFQGTLDELSGKAGVRNPFFCQACSALDMKDFMAHVKVMPFEREWKIGSLSVRLSDVKHLPGAASVRFADGTASCVFSGDLGSRRSRLVTDIAPAEKADAVFVEATYGDALYGTAAQTDAEYVRFQTAVGDAVRAGGVAWIPAFAMDRASRVLLEIQKGMAAGRIPPDVPVHFISSSSRDMTEKYILHPEWFDVPDMRDVKDLFARSLPGYPKNRESRYILVATSGMMEMGACRKLLPLLLPRPTTHVLLVGYQSPATPGGLLKAGARTLEIDGETIPVAAKVSAFGCFSGHGDAAENDLWLRNNHASRIFLIHGDEKALAARKKDLEARFKMSVEIARPGVVYEIGPHE
ncbi:MAG: MBL fold metallo-hydrolase [Kiritimatiellia bacterium]